MATTVTYKDNTLTTLNNGDTKTLKTAGTYLEDDIEISEVVNLQSLSVTPSTSQQIITADSYETITRTAQLTNSTGGSYASLGLNSETLSNYKYLRYNGTVKIYDSYNRLYWTVTFNNFEIGPITSKTMGAIRGDSSKYSVQNDFGGSLTDLYFYANYRSPWYYFYLGFYYNADASGTPADQFDGYFTFENFTIDYSNNNTWQNYDALEQITVNAIPSEYVVPTGTLNISANGTYDVSSYASAEVAVAGGASLQAKTVTPTTSNQTVTADSGYDGLSTVTVSAMPTGTTTAPTSISGTAATVSTGTNTLTLTKSVSVTPRVTTAGYVSAGTAGNSSVSLTANVTTKAAATITPGASNQTIAANTYLTGVQTIAGDANLVSSNILSGVSIFGVPGTVNVVSYRSGTAAPANSLGSDGDIYLQLAQ